MGEEKTPLDQQFASYAKFGDPRADGKAIKLSNIDRWLKQAELMGKKLTMTDTGFLEELSNEKKIPLEEMKDKLESCGLPGAKKKDGAKPAVALHRTPAY